MLHNLLREWLHPYNHGLRAFATTDQGLCLGTANPFYGTQVWIKRKDS